MGKEAKIGVAIILILVITFGVVLARRLTDTTDATVASTAEEEDQHTPKSTSGSVPENGKANGPADSSKEPTVVPATGPSGRVPKRSADTVSQWSASTDGGQTKPSIAPASPPWPMPKPSAPVPATPYQRYEITQQSPQSLQVQQEAPGSTDTDQTNDPFGSQSSQTTNEATARVDQSPNALRVIGPTAGQVPTYRQTARHSYTTRLNSAGSARQTAVSGSLSNLGSRSDTPGLHGEDGQYEVQPNDSYWVISTKLYGCGAYFKALAEHNRNAVPREDQLKVGDMISAPSMEELEETYPGLCPRPSRRETIRNRASSVSTRSSYVGGRTYTVEEGDTLFDIARYELGKASRWVEIHELNHGVLGKDFDYLTPGIELVLPDEGDANDTVTRRPGARSMYQR